MYSMVPSIHAGSCQSAFGDVCLQVGLAVICLEGCGPKQCRTARLSRFLHAHQDHVNPNEIRITQESWLGEGERFADIRVEVKDYEPYFIEVKYGYSPTEILESVTRKYGPGSTLGGASKIVVVIDSLSIRFLA